MSLIRYLAGILERLGPWDALVPPLPALTRYKREVAVKQVRAQLLLLLLHGCICGRAKADAKHACVGAGKLL